ncbi:hypothetical protein Tco_0875397 [Tanacetum coccineum]|uniref:Uncharacterized protein n=1 Tax=Tanacetum coccineum TaxID=301880 RepID=A0ABQ5BPP2_9ASTR
MGLCIQRILDFLITAFSDAVDYVGCRVNQKCTVLDGYSSLVLKLVAGCQRNKMHCMCFRRGRVRGVICMLWLKYCGADNYFKICLLLTTKLPLYCGISVSHTQYHETPHTTFSSSTSILEHLSDTKEHLKIEMEIPCSNKIKFITACSFSNDSFEDIMKAQVSVIKASATLNIQAFKIKKSVSISFRMTQVHKMAKDHMMMIRDYDWMMISKKLKDHIQVKLKPKSLKFTASDSQDTDQ